MGWRQTMAVAAAVGLIGAAGLATAYVINAQEVREAATDIATVMRVQSDTGAQEASVDEIVAEEETISPPAPSSELPDWIQENYLDGAEVVYDDMFGGAGGPQRVRLYERSIFFEEGYCSTTLEDWWLVLLVDRPDGTQIFYQDWEMDGSLNAVAFTQEGEMRFYENDLVRIFRDGNEEVLWEYGIGGPLFDEGNPQLASYLSAIYGGIGTYEERHSHPECDPGHLQQEDLGILRGER